MVKPAPIGKKENATLQQRIEVLNWHHANGKNQSKTANHFNVIYPSLRLKQPRISVWLKNEGVWRAEYDASTGGEHTNKRIRQTQHPEVMEMLDLWVSKAMADNMLLTGEVLRQKWKKFAELVGVPDDERLKLSEGWLNRYKARNGLKGIKRHGEAASVAMATAEKERLRVQNLIKEKGYARRDIFNADESPLFFA